MVVRTTEIVLFLRGRFRCLCQIPLSSLSSLNIQQALSTARMYAWLEVSNKLAFSFLVLWLSFVLSTHYTAASLKQVLRISD